MNQEQIKQAAQMLYDAEKNCKPIDLLSKQFPGIDPEGAYAVQLEYVRLRREKDGAIDIGKKIGLTSKAMQKFAGVDEPDYGHLFSDMYVEMDVPIEVGKMLAPKIETEIAFIMKKELQGPGVKATDVLEATAGIIASFEIIDSRYNEQIKFEDTVADNGSSARLVVGTQIVDVKSVDMRHMGIVIEKNGEIIDSAAGGAVMGNPAVAVAWLANKVAAYGVKLMPGDIVLSGSVAAAYPAAPGDVFRATFDGLGAVQAKFV
jgi:2-keto-4-pentenoate hydratase